MNSLFHTMRQKKIRFYFILVFGVAIFYSFGDPIVQDKKLSPLEYILMEEELMDYEETIPRVNVQIIASDNVDTAYVSPAETFPSQKGTWTFNYIPKIDTFALGGKVILEVPFAFLPNQKSWTYPQITISSSAGFVKVRSSNPATNISLRLGSRRPYDFNITATFTGVPPVLGDTISLIYGDTSGSLNGRATSNVHATDYDFRVLTDKLGTNLWTVVTPIPSIRVVPNPAKYFKITVPSLLTTQKSVTGVIIAFDEYNNIDPGFLGSLSLSCLGGTNCGTTRILGIGVTTVHKFVPNLSVRTRKS